VKTSGNAVGKSSANTSGKAAGRSSANTSGDLAAGRSSTNGVRAEGEDSGNENVVEKECKEAEDVAQPRSEDVAQQQTGARKKDVAQQQTGARSEDVAQQQTGARKKDVAQQQTGARSEDVAQQQTGARKKNVAQQQTGARRGVRGVAVDLRPKRARGTKAGKRLKRQMPKVQVGHTRKERTWFALEKCLGRSASEACARWAAERRAWLKRKRRKDGWNSVQTCRPRAAVISKLEERTTDGQEMEAICMAVAISKLEKHKTDGQNQQ
jgi:hypothetical protein